MPAPSVTPTREQYDAKGRHFRFAFIIALLAILIIGLTGLNAYQIRATAQERLLVTTQNLITLVERQVYDTMSKVDFALQTAVTEIDHELRRDGVQAQVQITEFLKRQHALLPEVIGFRAFDEHGDIRYGERLPAGEFVNVADRDYFKYLRDNSSAEVIVFGPIYPQISKRWSMSIARTLRDDGGNFRGAVIAAIPVEEFQKNLNLLNLGKSGAATLRMADMALIARATPSNKGTGIEYGSRTTSPQLVRAIAENPERGSYIAVTALDGIERVNAYMKVANYPMYVIVGVATQDVAPEWRRQALFVLTLGLVAMSLTALGAIWIARIRKREFNDQFSEIKRDADLALRQTHELLAMSEKAAGSGAWSWAIDSDQHNWSDQMFELFGLDPATTRASFDIWRKGLHPDDQAMAEQRISDSLRDHKPFSASYRVLRPNGDIVWVDAYGMPTYDADGKPIRLAGICVDATARRVAEMQLRESEQRYRQISNELEKLNAELEAKVASRTADLEAAMRTLEQISRRDALTGLPNRLAADERIRSEFVSMKRSRMPYAVMMLDIDHFKKVNDTFGHAVGDQVLQLIARTIRSSLRENDFVCRYGGEEFLVIVPATTLEAAIAVAEKVREAVGAVRHPVSGFNTISIGVAAATVDDTDEDAAIKVADDRLYDAKRTGRNRVVATS